MSGDFFKYEDNKRLSLEEMVGTLADMLWWPDVARSLAQEGVALIEQISYDAEVFRTTPEAT